MWGTAKRATETGKEKSVGDVLGAALLVLGEHSGLQPRGPEGFRNYSGSAFTRWVAFVRSFSHLESWFQSLSHEDTEKSLLCFHDSYKTRKDDASRDVR